MMCRHFKVFAEFKLYFIKLYLIELFSGVENGVRKKDAYALNIGRDMTNLYYLPVK